MSKHRRRQATSSEVDEARIVISGLLQYGDDSIEVDDDALVSECEDGSAWVQGWIRIELASKEE